MRRSIALVGFALLAACHIPPASAQKYAGNLADQYAKEGKAQVAKAKRYAASPSAGAYMSAPRAKLNHGSIDESGRVDMSGRVPPSYFKFREPSPRTSGYGAASAVPGRRLPPPAYVPRTVAPTTTSARRSPFDSIPPAPR